MSSSSLRLGVDTGGTFTDFILQSGVGLRRYKLPSTPHDPSLAILQGLDYFFPQGAPANLEIVHGTTVGTNAFLERKGGRPLLVMTKGFETIMALGRQNRGSLFDLGVMAPPPIIDDVQIIGVLERIDSGGNVVVPLDERCVDAIRAQVTLCRADSVVICFLHSYLNGSHERRVQDLLGDLAIPVLCSLDVLPEFREFERCSTTLINGYLAPMMSAYIDRLAAALGGRLLSVQQSNGGIMAAEAVQERAVHTLLSGPAAGVQGAFALAAAKGDNRLITFDMGGTSTDVSLCDGGLSLTKEYRLGGYPVGIPVLDIHTVGAGGGSVAYVDQAGVLHVGPESAGADPGPVCYGKGEMLTVTDANLLLGRIVPETFLAGRMVLDVERTRHVAAAMAERLHITVDALCLGIVAIVNAGMVKAVRTVSLDRGYDPADFSLYSFGGSSGLHCCELAEELSISTIEIPARAGVLSAQGLVFAPPLLDKTRSLFLQGERCNYETIQTAAQKLEHDILIQLKNMVNDGRLVCESFADLRYAGQSYEITLPVNRAMLQQFHEKHHQMFGYDLDQDIECVSLRSLAKHVRNDELRVLCTSDDHCNSSKVVTIPNSRDAGELLVYDRADLAVGQMIAGPCLIVDDYTTIFVTPLFHVHIDGQGSLTLNKERLL